MSGDQLALAAPFAFAAVAQVLAGVVQRVGDQFTRNHFAALERATVTLEWEGEIPPDDRVHRLAEDVIPDSYRVDEIMTVVSKNTEGISVLAGSLTLACAALAVGFDRGGVGYGIAVLLPALIGVCSAAWFWVQDSDNYRERRWLGISRVGAIIALVNLVFAIGVLIAMPATGTCK